MMFHYHQIDENNNNNNTSHHSPVPAPPLLITPTPVRQNQRNQNQQQLQQCHPKTDARRRGRGKEEREEVFFGPPTVPRCCSRTAPSDDIGIPTIAYVDSAVQEVHSARRTLIAAAWEYATNKTSTDITLSELDSSVPLGSALEVAHIMASFAEARCFLRCLRREAYLNRSGCKQQRITIADEDTIKDDIIGSLAPIVDGDDVDAFDSNVELLDHISVPNTSDIPDFVLPSSSSSSGNSAGDVAADADNSREGNNDGNKVEDINCDDLATLRLQFTDTLREAHVHIARAFGSGETPITPSRTEKEKEDPVAKADLETRARAVAVIRDVRIKVTLFAHWKRRWQLRSAFLTVAVCQRKNLARRAFNQIKCQAFYLQGKQQRLKHCLQLWRQAWHQRVADHHYNALLKQKVWNKMRVCRARHVVEVALKKRAVLAVWRSRLHSLERTQCIINVMRHRNLTRAFLSWKLFVSDRRRKYRDAAAADVFFKRLQRRRRRQNEELVRRVFALWKVRFMMTWTRASIRARRKVKTMNEM
eukprot:PhM_4_TR15950/c3_g2_i1/m.102800